MLKNKQNGINYYCRLKLKKQMHYVSSWCRTSCHSRQLSVICHVGIDSVVHLNYYHNIIFISIKIICIITPCVLHTKAIAFIKPRQINAALTKTTIKIMINADMHLIDQANNTHYHMTRCKYMMILISQV